MPVMATSRLRKFGGVTGRSCDSIRWGAAPAVVHQSTQITNLPVGEVRSSCRRSCSASGQKIPDGRPARRSPSTSRWTTVSVTTCPTFVADPGDGLVRQAAQSGPLSWKTAKAVARSSGFTGTTTSMVEGPTGTSWTAGSE